MLIQTSSIKLTPKFVLNIATVCNFFQVQYDRAISLARLVSVPPLELAKSPIPAC